MIEPRLYLQNPFDLANDAEVSSVRQKKGSWRVSLTRSLMEPENPEGGDVGVIEGSNGKLEVERVTWDGNLRTQIHSGRLEGSFAAGERVTVRVDPSRRLRNAVYHTTSHLLTSVARHVWKKDIIGKLNLEPDSGTLVLVGQAGEHGRAGALESEVQEYLASDRPVEVFTLEASEAIARCGALFQDIVPRAVQRWRVVELKRTPFPPIPCGGVHIDNLRRVTQVKFMGFERRENDLLINYTSTYST
jgi:Ser-tRNA(Ala) deacylase AlaX